MAKVVVVGSTNTDMSVRVPRLPGAGETVAGRDFRVSGGGKGANQAVAAARAGARVIFASALGTDDVGDRAVADLAAEGLDVRFVRRIPDAPSGVALILVDDAGENVIAVAAGANAELRSEDVTPLEAVVEPGDVLLVQLEIPLATVDATARLAGRRHARLILNPAPSGPLPDAILGAASIVTPNEHEAAQLTGIAVGDAAGLARAARALHDRGVADVLITRGARGVFVSSRGTAATIPAFAVDAVDTTAAGDIFNGALSAALIEGAALADAVSFANAAAAISVTRPGARTSAPTRVEIDAWRRLRPSPSHAVS